MSNKYKSRNRFCYNHPDKPNYLKGLCMYCYNKQYYKNHRTTRIKSVKKYQDRKQKVNPEQFKLDTRNANLKKAYGITLEDYNKMFKQQHGKCAVCDKKYKASLHVDHNHQTGKVRELLCPACNYLVAIVENVTLLLKLRAYITKHEFKKEGGD